MRPIINTDGQHQCMDAVEAINPYTYLVDVLQRVSQHPANRAVDLTPRTWKEQFADNVLKSDLEGLGQ